MLRRRFTPRAIHAGLIWGAFLAVAICWADARGQDAVIDADNVVVVLDASGSMAERMPGTYEPKMKVAKAALWEVVRQVPTSTNVGLLVFSGRGKQGDWLHPLAPVDRELFQRSLARLEPDGGTPLGRYIKTGADRLLEQRDAQRGYGTFRLIIVTDGEATDPELVSRYTPEVLSRGFTVEAIGVAMASEHALANRVHVYRRADDPGALREALTSAVAEIGTTARDTVADASEFDVIAAWPQEAAAEALAALRVSGNAPIGENPASPAVAGAASDAAWSVGGNAGSGKASGGFSVNVSFFGVVILVIVFSVVLRVLKALVRKD